MKFKVKISGFNGSWAVATKDTSIGTDGVDRIRRTVGVELPLERIKGNVGLLETDPTLELSFEQAKGSCLFKGKNTLRLKVLRGGLNDHCHTEVYSHNDDKTGEIKEAGIKWVVDEEAILNTFLKNKDPQDLDESCEIED